MKLLQALKAIRRKNTYQLKQPMGGRLILAGRGLRRLSSKRALSITAGGAVPDFHRIPLNEIVS